MDLSDRASEEALIRLIKQSPHENVQKLLLANITPDNFYNSAFKAFYKCATSIFLSGSKAINLAEINTALVDAVQNKSINKQTLEALQSIEPGTEEELGDISLHAKRIASYHTVRKGIEVVEKWKGEAIKYPLKIKEMMPALASQLLSLTEDGVGVDPRPSAIINEAEQSQRGVPVSTGMKKIDRVLRGGGFFPGHLHIVGAPTAHGKTSLACTLTVNVAKSKPVLYISTEMQAVDILYRVISNLTGLLIDEVMFPPDDKDILERKQQAIEFIDQRVRVYQTVRTVQDVLTRMRWHVSDFGELGLVIVDHLHRLQGLDSKTMFINSRMKENTLWRMAIDQLHEGAKSLGVPMLIFAQLSDESSRELIQKSNLTQLKFKESGDLANEADYGWLLFKDRQRMNVGNLLLKKDRYRGVEQSIVLQHDPLRYYFTDEL